MIELHLGDCLEILSTMPEMSVDAIVTDPPYGLSFMGKKWDYDVPDEAVWQECLRVLKPGGHLLCFAGTRTQHRMAVRIEDAGFEIRDMIAWVYGSGFPKSADVSKHLDAHERKTWLNVCKALDKTDQCAILETWKRFSKTVSNAGLLFTKSETATGTNTPKNGSALASVVLQANHENRDALAVIAELRLSEAPHITEVSLPSVLSFAENIIMESSDHAITAERLQERLGVTILEQNGIALGVVRDWQNANITDNLKAVEALKIWLGDKLSSKRADTVALCAALTGDLKHIILSQSETFRSFDMTRQTDCASAINVTIMESTAASLISFMVNTLRSKAIDKAAGAEREVVGIRDDKGRASTFGGGETKPTLETAPATDAAKTWQGWGTALKPALETITVARKPLIGTVAENVLQYGTGAINVDGCRVETNGERPTGSGKKSKGVWDLHAGSQYQGHGNVTPEAGRFPANFIHDGSEEVVGLFPVTKPSKATQRGSVKIFEQGEGQWIGESTQRGHDDSGGSAARFFYCAKASKADRDEGLESGLQWIDSLELIWYDNTLNLISEVFLWECQGQNQSMGLSGEALPLKVILGDMMQEPKDKDSPMLSHGKQRMVKYLKAIKFTTLTGIKKTIELKILNFLNLLPTSEYTEDAIKTITGSGLSLVESVALKNLLKLIITKEKTEYHLGASNAAKITQQKTNAKDELKRLCSRNTHSTVKPTDLMRYLCRLVTPPGGIVLDPFMGSGSTGKAAMLEGFNFIGIEREPEYMEIARARIHAAMPTNNATVYEQLSFPYL